MTEDEQLAFLGAYGLDPGTVPEGLDPVYVHRQSRPLSSILTEILRYSNNYIANQVFHFLDPSSLQ